jgi:hypothetical protein
MQRYTPNPKNANNIFPAGNGREIRIPERI